MTASTEPRGGLEYGWDPGEDGWGPSMNANLLRLSRVGFHPSVVSKSTIAPPGSPVSGEGYVVPSGATGAWSGQSGKIAIWDGAAWAYIAPRDGFLVHVADADGLALYDGGAWSADVLRSDRLATAYAHSQATGNPHGATAADVGALAAIFPNFAGILYQDGTQRIAPDGTGWFQYLNSFALIGSTIRPLVVRADGFFVDQDAATFRGTISVPPVLSFTGSVDAKALNGGKAGLYRLAASTYTNFWTGITAGQQASVLQLESPTGLRTLIASDNKAGGLLTRFQASDFPGDDWSDWYTLWDSGSLPVGVTGRAVLATTTQAGARTAIGAAPLAGVTDGSNAASGVVGQYYEAFLPEASFVYAVNGSPVAVLSLSLPAGDWLVEGRATAHITGAMNGNKVVSGLNTSIAIPTDGTEVYGGLQVFSATNGFQTMTGSKRFSLTATTTVYLVARIDFSAGTPALFGCMSARRMR